MRVTREEAPVWVIAGVLLGLVVLAALIGFHVGPHAHVLAGVIGLLAAASLVAIAVAGGATALLWVLLAGDLTLSAGVAYLAWRALAMGDRPSGEDRLPARTGASGVAVSDLDPEGIVKVQGEEWSALAINAPVRSGTTVQVVGRGGVRLEVWGDETPDLLGDAEAVTPEGEGR